ncbi:hypothetical protein M408DRAFT_20440 [Serendipita vermifera MAFF 305830]|uniref:Uncharacterized protein n=1 Tax=Serendipita vermifera MAFF 305830 TaxID=933852 RepID=A0A0C2W239_SERVB|nr:hypothetical protein M408DRAFT_12957 [Serendipita vermifera MAFF 305830]KIM32089.1 hypothetical protein M408DRAFT_20440 [Serendipita vermifera MAFF 305830]
MRILGPERTRRALWLMYSRLTSTPLHTAYTLVLLLSSIILLSLHLASLTNTHVSLSKLVTLLSIARPEDSSVIVPTFSSRDGQPVLQLCNVGQSDCQIVTSASPSASSEVPQQADSPSSAVPTTTAQQSNAEATPFVDVGVQGNGVVSVSSASSTTISSTSSVASPISSASSTSVSSSSSSSGLFIADVGVSTTASSVSGSAVVSLSLSSSALVEPTLVLLGPSTNATASASSTTTTQAIQETRATSTSEPARTTTTVVQGQPDNITSENRPPPPTTAGRPTETSTSQTTSETSTSSTRTETTTSATTTATDVTANDISLSASTSQTVPVLPTAAELTTAGKNSGTETEISASQTVTISSSSSSSAIVPEATDGVAIQVLPPAPGIRSRIQLSARKSRPLLWRRAFSAVPVLDSGNGSLSGIDVTDVEDDGGGEVTRLNVICALAMAFPESQLQQSQMEDLVFIVFYVWLAGIGLAAIMNESTPHLITVFLSSLFALLWSGTQVMRTRALRAQFDAFITHGACGGVDVLPFYWTQRERLELPTVIINALAILIFAGMSLGLLKRYHKKTRMNRYVYNVFLVLRSAILLGMFFLGAASVLWVQQLFSATASAYGITPTLSALRAMGIISIVLAIPLGAMGWWALKVEERSGAKARWVMAVFVVLDLFFVAQWTATFASDVYREVFTRWTFFAALSVGGFFLLVGSLGAGVICWMRFGKALVRGSAFSEKLASEAGHVRGNSGTSRSLVNDSDDFGVGEGIIPQIREIPWDYTNSGAERAWEPFDRVSVRQSQFTTSSSDADRQSTAFSYGLRSPVPPVPRVGSFDSRMTS